MALKKDFNWAPRCVRRSDGLFQQYHRVEESFHWSHEHPQYTCFDCWERFTPLHQVDKRESYIEKVIRFFRWRTI